jgi:hypothetical protein
MSNAAGRLPGTLPGCVPLTVWLRARGFSALRLLAALISDLAAVSA